ncbi:hypothetical protein LINGRAHAP2_LOCUS20850, partial [Linum grandiflorum]
TPLQPGSIYHIFARHIPINVGPGRTCKRPLKSPQAFLIFGGHSASASANLGRKGFSEVFRVHILTLHKGNGAIMATLVGRSTCTLMRATFPRTICQSATRSKIISMPPSILPNATLRVSPASLSSPRMVLRRELSSLLPLHSATASACLVSKLPSIACSSSEGSFFSHTLLAVTSGS